MCLPGFCVVPSQPNPTEVDDRQPTRQEQQTNAQQLSHPCPGLFAQPRSFPSPPVSGRTTFSGPPPPSAKPKHCPERQGRLDAYGYANACSTSTCILHPRNLTFSNLQFCKHLDVLPLNPSIPAAAFLQKLAIDEAHILFSLAG